METREASVKFLPPCGSTQLLQNYLILLRHLFACDTMANASLSPIDGCLGDCQMEHRHSALRAGLLTSTAFAAVMMAGDAAQAACTPAAANDVTAICNGTTTNQGDGAPGTSAGIRGYGAPSLTGLNVTVMSGARVTGMGGISFETGSVTNYGTITGTTNDGIAVGGLSSNATVTNSGTIMSAATGVWAFGTLNVINSGNITSTSTLSNGVHAGNSLSMTNSGTITGDRGVSSNGTANVTNSGTIIGTGGLALRFNFTSGPQSDSLTILPGARFGGLADFGGGADTVTFGPGSWILNTTQFDDGLSTINTSGNAYAVTANQIVVADLSGFGAMNRAVMDITGWIASVLPDSPVFDTTQTAGATAFAAIESAAPSFDDAFANFPSALPYAPTPVFKGGTVSDARGNSVWAKGFGGRREQDTDNNFIGSVTQGFGGAIGFDGQVSANTRLGVLFGGSRNETTLQFNAGETDTDTLFGGIYSRTFFGASFLDLALIGGKLENDSKRNIGGGLTMETASASYDGWFVNPSLTLGHRIALSHNLTLTPALKARYVAAHFDGYTENGSTTNLTVAGRDVQALEERAELTLASVQYFGASRIVMRGTLGALAQQRTGDSTVNIVLVGQNFIAATPDKDNVFGLYGGGGFDWQTGNVALFASGEVTGTSDNTVAFAGKGGMRMVW